MLDNDFYKFSMMQTVFHRFPEANVEYELKVRNLPGEAFTPLIDKAEREVGAMCQLRFKPDELDYLRKFKWLSPNFIELLRCFQPNNDYVKVWEASNDSYYGKFRVRVKGSWLNTILFEVPILAIVSELYSRSQPNHTRLMNWGHQRVNVKYEWLKLCAISGFRFADFGTRRRFSKAMQNYMLNRFRHRPEFIGTSNVMFAKKYGVKPIGTMAHEYIMAMQALVRLRDSQKFALENWAQEFRGRLGIALSDTLGMDAFLKDFDLYFAKLFDGCRQDSGDPRQWAERLIAHYNALGIDPRTKTAVFSDNLNLETAAQLHFEFGQRIKTSFGIGTHLTNDTDMVAPQIVMKMTRCNGRPVAKISDSPGKSMCPDESYVNYLKSMFEV